MAEKSELRTQVNDARVESFLNAVADERKRADCFEILDLMTQATKETPKMWGSSIVGFGSYHYKGASGREGDWRPPGFSPRKENLTLYIMAGNKDNHDLLDKLGKHKASGGCLYLNRLSDVDQKVLRKLIENSFRYMKTTTKQ